MVRPASCIRVVMQAPHDRRSCPVPCHGCKQHKSTQTQGISASARCILKMMLPPTTHHEGLLRVGLLPCAPTYNRGVVQYMVFDCFRLAQSHGYSSKIATCKANSTAQTALQQHLICTEDVTAVRRTLQRLRMDMFSGHDCFTSSNPRTTTD